VISLLLMQFGWFACVLGAAKGMPWLGPSVVLLLIFLHLRKLRRAATETTWRERCGRETLILVIVLCLGILLEGVFSLGNVLRYPEPGLPPLWLVMLWPNFAMATAEGGSLRGLASRPQWGFVLGAIFGPLAYRGGVALAPVTFGEPLVRTYGILALVWACVVPTIFQLRRWLRA
jgi:Protein of unknown function (DUF2878)